MKPTLKLGFLAFALALLIGSTPSSAISCACSVTCLTADACYYLDCYNEDTGEWITCFEYLGGVCDF
jgi:hypothetical protein